MSVDKTDLAHPATPAPPLHGSGFLVKVWSLPEMRLGTSVMAGSPVPRVEDSGVVE